MPKTHRIALSLLALTVGCGLDAPLSPERSTERRSAIVAPEGPDPEFDATLEAHQTMNYVRFNAPKGVTFDPNSPGDYAFSDDSFATTGDAGWEGSLCSGCKAGDDSIQVGGLNFGYSSAWFYNEKGQERILRGGVLAVIKPTYVDFWVDQKFQLFGEIHLGNMRTKAVVSVPVSSLELRRSPLWQCIIISPCDGIYCFYRGCNVPRGASRSYDLR